ncbi:MAG: hypothetical protein ACRDLF_03710 [Solirubrobacteraceae bacterium]
MPLTTTPEKSPRTSRSLLPRTARPLNHAARLAAHDAVAAHGARDAHVAWDARFAARGTLARYTRPDGRLREVFTRPGHGGSVLVLDRDATTLGDRRLVAHLAADEPVENASLVCRHYLRDRHALRCRPVTSEDLLTAPFSAACAQDDSEPYLAPPPEAAEVLDRHGYLHRVEAFDAGLSIPELRWRRRRREIEREENGDRESQQCESVRDAVGCLESYEPIRALTAWAVERHREDPAVSVAVLRAELQRLDASRIVLNRGLRRAVLHAMRTQGLSLSEIAHRCGRVKRDGKGNASGETSWLSRRVGISSEGGRDGAPTPWIHSEVLALIARNGLGISPREVEL